MKKYLIIPIVTVVVLIFIFGIYAGATKTFPYNIIKSVKDDLDSDLRNVETSVILNFDAGSLININEENDVYQKKQKLIQYIWKTDQLPQKVPADIVNKINDPSWWDNAVPNKTGDIAAVKVFNLTAIIHLPITCPRKSQKPQILLIKAVVEI